MIATALAATFFVFGILDKVMLTRAQGLPVPPTLYIVYGLFATVLAGTAVALYCEKRWVRWVYLAAAVLAVVNALTPVALSLFMLIGSLMTGGDELAPSALGVLRTLAYPVACVVCAVVVYRHFQHAGHQMGTAAYRGKAADSVPLRSAGLATTAVSLPKPPLYQYLVCGAFFASLFTVQCVLLWRAIPFELLTPKLFNDFMLISMGLAFVPLGLLLALVAFAIFAMFSLAYLPAWLYWRSIAPARKPVRGR